MNNTLRFLTLSSICFLQILMADEAGYIICENEAGMCRYKEDGAEFIDCICADQEKNGKVYETATETSCVSALKKTCGTTVPPVEEVCKSNEILELCKSAMFSIGNCFYHGYTQDDVNEFENGNWNQYSRYVLSCCYNIDRNENGYSTYEITRDCIEENGCSQECMSMDNTETEKEDGNKEEETSSNGCSVLLI
jgi:hypothetical protein